MGKSPDLSNGGLPLPPTEDGLYPFAPPQTSSACKAVTLGDARDGWPSGPKKIITVLHVRWGHASAQQLKRELVDSGGETTHLANYADEVLELCEVCRATEEDPHEPVVGTSAVSLSNGRVQADALPSDDIVALRAMDVYPKNPSRYQCARKILRKLGPPPALHRVGSLGSQLVFGLATVANGEMRFGLTFFRSVALSSNFQARVGTSRFAIVVMALRAEFISTWWQMIAFRESKFTLGPNGV